MFGTFFGDLTASGLLRGDAGFNLQIYACGAGASAIPGGHSFLENLQSTLATDAGLWASPGDVFIRVRVNPNDSGEVQSLSLMPYAGGYGLDLPGNIVTVPVDPPAPLQTLQHQGASPANP